MTALKYSIQINGVTQLIMTKADVLECLDSFSVSEHYNINNTLIDYVPYELNV